MSLRTQLLADTPAAHTSLHIKSTSRAAALVILTSPSSKSIGNIGDKAVRGNEAVVKVGGVDLTGVPYASCDVVVLS